MPPRYQIKVQNRSSIDTRFILYIAQPKSSGYASGIWSTVIALSDPIAPRRSFTFDIDGGFYAVCGKSQGPLKVDMQVQVDNSIEVSTISKPLVKSSAVLEIKDDVVGFEQHTTGMNSPRKKPLFKLMANVLDSTTLRILRDPYWFF